MFDIVLADHAQEKMAERGATTAEVKKAILDGEALPAKHSRIAYRKNFQFNSMWAGKFYRIKQVVPITKREEKAIIVITVYTYYF